MFTLRWLPVQILRTGAGRMVRGRPKWDFPLRCVCASCPGSSLGVSEEEISRNVAFYVTAQSEEAPMRKHVASLDERLEMLSQKLARELSLTRIRWHVPRIPPHAIERITLSNGLASRITNTANLAARAMQRLPV